MLACPRVQRQHEYEADGPIGTYRRRGGCNRGIPADADRRLHAPMRNRLPFTRLQCRATMIRQVNHLDSAHYPKELTGYGPENGGRTRAPLAHQTRVNVSRAAGGKPTIKV